MLGYGHGKHSLSNLIKHLEANGCKPEKIQAYKQIVAHPLILGE